MSSLDNTKYLDGQDVTKEGNLDCPNRCEIPDGLRLAQVVPEGTAFSVRCPEGCGIAIRVVENGDA